MTSSFKDVGLSARYVSISFCCLRILFGQRILHANAHTIIHTEHIIARDHKPTLHITSRDHTPSCSRKHRNSYTHIQSQGERATSAWGLFFGNTLSTRTYTYTNARAHTPVACRKQVFACTNQASCSAALGMQIGTSPTSV